MRPLHIFQTVLEDIVKYKIKLVKIQKRMNNAF